MSAQYISAASEAEEQLLRKLVELKDRLQRKVPGFLADAVEVRKTLRAHDVRIYAKRQHEWSDAEWRAHRDNLHNAEVGRVFAGTWGLPYDDDPLRDPGYLFDAPYSGCPWIGGTLAAVQTQLANPPLVVLEVDIRFPKRLLRERIDDQLSRVRKAWKEGGGEHFPDLKREVQRLEKLVRAKEQSDRGRSARAIARSLKVNQKYTRRLVRQAEQIVQTRRVYMIAPYTEPRWDERRRKSFASATPGPVSVPVV